MQACVAKIYLSKNSKLLHSLYSWMINFKEGNWLRFPNLTELYGFEPDPYPKKTGIQDL